MSNRSEHVLVPKDTERWLREVETEKRLVDLGPVLKHLKGISNIQRENYERSFTHYPLMVSEKGSSRHKKKHKLQIGGQIALSHLPALHGQPRPGKSIGSLRSSWFE